MDDRADWGPWDYEAEIVRLWEFVTAFDEWFIDRGEAAAKAMMDARGALSEDAAMSEKRA